MSRKILPAVFLLFAAALVAVPQTHTFCALDLPCTVTGAWNFTGGLQSSGTNVATFPVNLAGGAGVVTGVLPGANYAVVNLAGGNNPGGVAGTLPGSSMAVFVASGASHAPGAVPDPGASAGTTHFLREDATWVAPSAAPTVTSINLAAASGNCSTQTFLTPGANALYRVDATLTVITNASTSSTTPSIVVSYTDADSNTTVGTVAGTIVNSNVSNVVGPVSTSGAIYINAKAGTAITFSCSGYAPNPALAMTYTVHARLEGTF